MEVTFDEELFWKAVEETKNNNWKYLSTECGDLYKNTNITDVSPNDADKKSILIIVEDGENETYVFAYEKYIQSSGVITAKPRRTDEIKKFNREETLEILTKLFPLYGEMIKEPNCD